MFSREWIDPTDEMVDAGISCLEMMRGFIAVKEPSREAYDMTVRGIFATMWEKSLPAGERPRSYKNCSVSPILPTHG